MTDSNRDQTQTAVTIDLVRLRTAIVLRVTCLIALLLTGASAHAQCQPAWSDEFAERNPNGVVRTTLVADLGDGPRLIVGGSFTAVGTLTAPGIAAWDGDLWTPLGAGISGTVYAMAMYDDDGPGPHPPALYIGGQFTGPGGILNIARWNGANWQPVGGGLFNAVYALAVFDVDGPGPQAAALYAGGQNARLVRWDGITWTAVAEGEFDIQALAVYGEDDSVPPSLIVAGSFATFAGVPAQHIARWNGQVWSPLGAGTSLPLFSLTVFDDDGSGPNRPSLFAGGFSIVAKWDGAWTEPGTGLSGIVYSLEAYQLPTEPLPKLIAGGVLNFGSQYGAAILSNGVWSVVGSGATRYTIASFDDDGAGPRPALLYLGGNSTTRPLARWNGVSQSAPGRGFNGDVSVLGEFDDDGPGPHPSQLYAGGRFTSADGLSTQGLARYDGRHWWPVTGLSGPTTVDVRALTSFDPDGPGPGLARLYVGGAFASAGGQPAPNIAAWDGSAWATLGGGAPGNSVDSLSVFDEDGAGPLLPSLIVGGNFTITQAGINAPNIARWDGAAWSTLGGGLPGEYAQVLALATFDEDGSGPLAPALFAAGTFSEGQGAPGRLVARWWDGAWTNLGGDMEFIYGMEALRVFDDDGPGPHPAALYAAGSFYLNVPTYRAWRGIAKWDGQSWSGVGSLFGEEHWPARDLTVVDPDGQGPASSSLIVCGTISTAGGIPVANIAAWDGTTWAALAGGVYGDPRAMLTFDDDGPGQLPASLYVAGTTFTNPPNSPFSGRVIRWGCTPSYCYANCDASTASPVLNANDFQCFLNKFAAADPYANCDGSTVAPILNANDFQCFLNKYAAGCT